jgi:hypothetical protein
MKHALLLAMLAILAGACGRSPAEPGPTDGGAQGTSPVDAAVPCSSNPQTYLEIINACTDAQAIDKVVNLAPMSLPDGGLQPLP